MQKEPKLARARQIPEWSVYDSEIAQFARGLAQKGLIHSDAAAVDIDALASVGGAAKADKADEAVEADSTADASTSSTTNEAISAEPSTPEHTRDEL